MAHKNLNNKIDKLAQKTCVEAANRMAGHESALTFVESLLTNDEKIKIGRRLLIAQAILRGETRMEICDKLKISPNTFRQVKVWLESEFKNYKPKRKKTAPKYKQRRHYREVFSYQELKRKYPAHFLLFSAAEAIFKKNK